MAGPCGCAACHIMPNGRAIASGPGHLAQPFGLPSQPLGAVTVEGFRTNLMLMNEEQTSSISAEIYEGIDGGSRSRCCGSETGQPH